MKATKEAIATEKDRKLAIELVRRRKKIWKETAKRIRVKQEILLQQKKITPTQRLDQKPLQEAQKWHSSLKM